MQPANRMGQHAVQPYLQRLCAGPYRDAGREKARPASSCRAPRHRHRYAYAHRCCPVQHPQKITLPAESASALPTVKTSPANLWSTAGVMATISIVELIVKNATEHNPVYVLASAAGGGLAYYLLEPFFPKVEEEDFVKVGILHTDTYTPRAQTRTRTQTYRHAYVPVWLHRRRF